MKKIISLLLCASLLLLTFVACTNTPEEPSATDSNNTQASAAPTAEVTETEEKNQYDVTDDLPATLRYDGETINILCRSRDWFEDEIAVPGFNANVIDEAIYKRNLLVTEKYGIAINSIPAKEGNDAYLIRDKVRIQISDGSLDYDLVDTTTYSTFPAVTDGIFADLCKIQNLDLTKPWWHQGFNQAASFKGRQYFACGAANLSAIRFLFVTFINHEVLENNNLAVEDLYKMVEDKKWTLDAQLEISTNIYADLDSDNLKSGGDLFGFVTNGDQIGVDPYWSACRLNILEKDVSGNYIYALDKDRLVMAVDKINKLVWDVGSWSVDHTTADGEQATIVEMFAENRAAMATLRVFEAEGETMRDMRTEYSILPMPMLDEEQKEYYSYAHDQFTGFAIPSNIKGDRLEMVGAFMSAFNAESYRTVMPAFYELALKGRYLKNPESAAMMDLVYNSFYVDAGILYTKAIESVHQKLRTLIGKNNTAGVVTAMKPLDRVVALRVTTLNTALDALANP